MDEIQMLNTRAKVRTVQGRRAKSGACWLILDTMKIYWHQGVKASAWLADPNPQSDYVPSWPCGSAESVLS